MAKCPKIGTRVCFRANPAARMFYDRSSPGQGTCGTVTTVSLGSRKATCMPGPRGGLVYVDWDGARIDGVFRVDLVNERTGAALAGRRKRRR